MQLQPVVTRDEVSAAKSQLHRVLKGQTHRSALGVVATQTIFRTQRADYARLLAHGGLMKDIAFLGAPMVAFTLLKSMSITRATYFGLIMFMSEFTADLVQTHVGRKYKFNIQSEKVLMKIPYIAQSLVATLFSVSTIVIGIDWFAYIFHGMEPWRDWVIGCQDITIYNATRL